MGGQVNGLPAVHDHFVTQGGNPLARRVLGELVRIDGGYTHLEGIPSPFGPREGERKETDVAIVGRREVVVEVAVALLVEDAGDLVFQILCVQRVDLVHHLLDVRGWIGLMVVDRLVVTVHVEVAQEYLRLVRDGGFVRGRQLRNDDLIADGGQGRHLGCLSVDDRGHEQQAHAERQGFESNHIH